MQTNQAFIKPRVGSADNASDVNLAGLLNPDQSCPSIHESALDKSPINSQNETALRPDTESHFQIHQLTAARPTLESKDYESVINDINKETTEKLINKSKEEARPSRLSQCSDLKNESMMRQSGSILGSIGNPMKDFPKSLMKTSNKAWSRQTAGKWAESLSFERNGTGESSKKLGTVESFNKTHSHMLKPTISNQSEFPCVPEQRDDHPY